MASFSTRYWMVEAERLAHLLYKTFAATELVQLRDDPFVAIPHVVPSVEIELVDSVGGFDCSVAGRYVQTIRRISVEISASTRRTKFTALHELGHDQARRHKVVAKRLAQLGDDGLRLEEKVADAFAAMILVPDLVVDEILAHRAPTAHDVVKLFKHADVAGSREACCVRIAQRMSGNGYVLLCQEDLVLFCAPVGAAYRIRRRTPQDRDHFITRALSSGGAVTDNHVRLRHSTGTLTPELSGQALADGDYVFSVLTDASTLPWGGFRLPRTGDAARPQLPEVWCDDCDDACDAGRRCDRDPSHWVCRRCGWCECRKPPPLVEKTCEVCWEIKAAHLFPDGGNICEEHGPNW